MVRDVPPKDGGGWNSEFLHGPLGRRRRRRGGPAVMRRGLGTAGWRLENGKRRGNQGSPHGSKALFINELS